MNKGGYDVIVIGQGTMGSASSYWLAKRGHRVLGLDQFSVPHENGSHTGQSRIIRKAYFEHPDYVPLLEDAYEGWAAIEKESGEKLYSQTGLLYIGAHSSVLLEGVRIAAHQYSIPVEEFDTTSCRKAFPQFAIPDGHEAIFEPEAGFLVPEKAISAFHKLAISNGVAIHVNEKVIEWKREENEIVIITDKNSYRSKKLVITAGAWAAKLLPSIEHKLNITRQIIAWVDPPKREEFALGKFPCWLLEDDQRGIYYGFPVLPKDQFESPAALKIAHHHPGITTDPDQVDRSINAADEEDINYALEKYLPKAGKQINQWKTCLYTNSPDEHFVVDHLPGYDHMVTIATGFSGHGFKFAPVIGKAVADLSTDGHTSVPVGFLQLSRLDKL